MTIEEIRAFGRDFSTIEKETGVQLFEAPIFAFGAAEDDLFMGLKNTPEAIGAHFRAPLEWMPAAKTVISFFLPFSEAVRKSNRVDATWPSEEWQHGRYEGQMMIAAFTKQLVELLSQKGYETVAPALTQDFWNVEKAKDGKAFTSNWSERHVAFVCGLGTFGLSKGLITEKGVAGRFGSVVTALDVSPSERTYTELYENCSMCGACVKKCPVQAISMEHGKNHDICCDYMNVIREKYKPRQGCGKCQVKVPCESRIPTIQKKI
ncbi:MAG: 4Fe-4S binding protein [Clostridia bacterium]